MVKVDLVTGGEGQVSSYLKEREIINYVKSKSHSEESFIVNERKVLTASKRYLNLMYRRMAEDINVSLHKLLKPIPRGC